MGTLVLQKRLEGLKEQAVGYFCSKIPRTVSHQPQAINKEPLPLRPLPSPNATENLPGDMLKSEEGIFEAVAWSSGS